MLYVECSAIQQLLRESYSYLCVSIVCIIKYSLYIEQRELNEMLNFRTSSNSSCDIIGLQSPVAVGMGMDYVWLTYSMF